MKKCLCCGASAATRVMTCPACGEASWSEAVLLPKEAELPPAVSQPETAKEAAPVEEPQVGDKGAKATAETIPAPELVQSQGVLSI